MKKILINCLSARSGGAVSYLRNAIGRILVQGNAGSKARFLALCDARQSELVDVDPAFLLAADTAGMSGLKRSFWERRNLPELVDRHGITTLFTPYQVSSVKTGARSVLMLRNMEPFFFRRYQYAWKTRLRNHVLRRSTIRSVRAADHVIAVSEFARRQLIDQIGVPNNRVTRIYHGRDTFFSGAGDADQDRQTLRELGIKSPFLLTCGSLLPYRRCEDVIRAFSRLAGSPEPVPDLVIAGDGSDGRYRKKLHDLANQSELSDRIRFVGHVSKEQIRSLYQLAELVILATELEACPNIAIECMSASAAILASESDPLPEIIGRENACFFPARDPGFLSDRILHLSGSKDETRLLRHNARLRADDYCWQRCAEKTVALLEDI